MNHRIHRCLRSKRFALAAAAVWLFLAAGCVDVSSSVPTPAQATASARAAAVPTATVAASPTPAATRPAPTATPDVPVIAPAQLKALLAGANQPAVFDTRDRVSYDYGHLPGAVSLPSGELAARLSEVPRDRMVVVYCTGAT